jgi:hypothetical protein
MKALVNFVPSDAGAWQISFLAEDAKTPIGKTFVVRDMDTMLRVLRKLRGNENTAQATLYNWGQGSEWIDLSPPQCHFFGIAEGQKNRGNYRQEFGRGMAYCNPTWMRVRIALNEVS